MMGYYDYGYYPRHDGFETIITVLCWVAVITFIVYVVKRHGMCHGKHCGRHKELGERSAMDILKERYAKGEIEKKEFEEKKKDLGE